MEQPPITDFFAPDAGGPMHPEEAIDDHFELGALSLTFLIYLYRCAATGAAVYVGQTMQALDNRDRQHLGSQGAPGSFDDIYTDPNMFTLEILDTATFAADVQTREEYRALLRRAAEWADRRETEEIDRHGTYDPHGPGLNRTRGGQGGALQASLEAMYLRSCERWANVYRPEFEAYLAEHGTLHNIPARSYLHETLGTLVSNIRTGHTSVPPEHLEWLLANGFVMDYRQSRWDHDYLPAFEAHLSEHGSLRDIPHAHPTIGNLVNNIRTGNTLVPAEHMEWLLANGFVMNHRQSIWDQDYRPAFEVHLSEHGSLRHIPQSHPVLGSIVSNIRTGHTSVPPEHMEWLLANGFVMNAIQARWDQDYRPAFEAHLSAHRSLRHIPKSHPVLGHVVSRIRNGTTSVPPEHMEWLLANGFVMNAIQARWDQDYRPAFEAHLAEHGSLHDIPHDVTIIGNLVNSIRNGTTSVPSEHMEWLLANGFAMNHHQGQWDHVYRPAFEAHLAEHGSLRHIPQCHPTLGTLVGSIRTGNTSVPSEHMEWLLANGFVMNCQQARWDLDYRPAFEAHLMEHGTLRDFRCKHPTVGGLVHQIRTGNTSVPPEHLDWLRANGFRWSAKNVAAHVAGYLGMERAELPAEATESEAVMHCLAEASRLELFGRRSVPELSSMYREQRARL